MKKLMLVMLSFLILSGCGNSGGEKKQDNAFSTIKEAVQKQLTIKCEYTDDDGEKVLTYMKGEVVRLRGTGKQSDVEGLIKNGKFYLWSNTKNEGMELDMAKLADGGELSMGGKKINSLDDVVAILEEKKQNCVVDSNAGDIFEVPSNVKFQQ